MTEAPPTARAPRVLVIDDGDRQIELAHALLRDFSWVTRCTLPGPCWECAHRPGCDLTHAHDLLEAREVLSRHRDVDVVVLDLVFAATPPGRLLVEPGGDPDAARRLQGLAILKALRAEHPDLPVILATSRDELGLEGLDAALGADELVTLAGPAVMDARMLALLIERVVARQREAGGDLSFFIGRDRRLRRLVRDAEVLARTSLPLLVTGETGVGKSAFVERIIHPATRRRGPFVAVDLAALPETLVSAELFGTSRGAFSGAVDRPGCLERAHHGTLLLDEIGNLASEAQRALLTTLQTRRVTRLGGTQARELDVKVVTATNADLAALVAGGRMRADLLARLNPAARLTLPPLRERPEDLPALAAHLVTRLYSGGPDHELLAAYAAAARLDGPSPEARLATTGERPATGREIVFTLTPRELGLLIRHPWPGNVRELEQVLAAATLAALGDALQAAEAGRSPGTPAARRVIPIPPRIWRELLGADAPATRRPAVADAPSATLHDVARELERRLYARLFVECQGDFAAMAGRLLVGDPGANARRVRLRFNQLGLRARALSADSI